MACILYYFLDCYLVKHMICIPEKIKVIKVNLILEYLQIALKPDCLILDMTSSSISEVRAYKNGIFRST